MISQASEPQAFSVEHLARRWNVSARHIRRMLAAGKLPQPTTQTARPLGISAASDRAGSLAWEKATPTPVRSKTNHTEVWIVLAATT